MPRSSTGWLDAWNLTLAAPFVLRPALHVFDELSMSSGLPMALARVPTTVIRQA